MSYFQKLQLRLSYYYRSNPRESCIELAYVAPTMLQRTTILYYYCCNVALFDGASVERGKEGYADLKYFETVKIKYRDVEKQPGIQRV